MDTTALEEQRAGIERELAELRLQHPFPTLEGITAHNNRIEALEQRLAELDGQPAVKPRKPWTYSR